MKNYKTIETKLDQGILTILLNRPEVHNAFDEVMLQELTDCFKATEDEKIVCVVLRGNGKSFCAGVDLKWMKAISQNDYQRNYDESLLLARCFYLIYTCLKPTIAVAHGAVLGGANGLLAACDLAYCADDSVFSLSEVKIGIVPSCISPYVIKRVGEYASKELMLTGRRFDGKEAEQLKLVNKSVPHGDLENVLNHAVRMLRTSGPNAMTHCKEVINKVSNDLTLTKAIDYTARMIADIRASEEGQEGMNAFLEKRRPSWTETKNNSGDESNQ
jgi:methylglutaconyl-CoA hydratase